MKTAVSLPDDVFTKADHLAKSLKLSRSELYSRALSEFLARHSREEITSSWDTVIAEIGQPEKVGIASARAVFEQVEW